MHVIKIVFLLVPCNLGNYHWVGLWVAIDAQGQAQQVVMFHPLGTQPTTLKPFTHYIQHVYPNATIDYKDFLQQLDLKSCGAVVIEGLWLLSTSEVDVRQSVKKFLSEEEIIQLRW